MNRCLIGEEREGVALPLPRLHLLEEEETAVLLEVLPLHRGEPLLLSDGVCAGHAGSEQDHEDAATHWIGLSTKCMLHVRWKYMMSSSCAY